MGRYSPARRGKGMGRQRVAPRAHCGARRRPPGTTNRRGRCRIAADADNDGGGCEGAEAGTAPRAWLAAAAGAAVVWGQACAHPMGSGAPRRGGRSAWAQEGLGAGDAPG